MTLQVQAYLCFEGCCEAALNFYRDALGAKIDTLSRFKDCPEPMTDDGCAAGGDGAGPSPDMVMHAAFTIGRTQLLASDGRGSGKPSFEGSSLALNPAGAAETERLFNALADGGKVQMPLGMTFFSPAFGMVVDKFGVGWMVAVQQ